MDKPYVGFWWRFLAYLIDFVVIMVAFFILSFIPGLNVFASAADPMTGMPTMSPVSMIIQIVVPLAYWAVMQASSMQATVGKMAIGAIVTDANGERMGYGKSFIREICKYPSALVLAIGFIMIGFTARKQGLHDIMAGTLVVKKKMADQMAGASA